MRVSSVTLSKEFKKGLPSFSNITVGVTMTWEITEGEKFDFPAAWDLINQQINIQADNEMDPSWMKTKETTKNFITTIKTPKKGGEKYGK
jgi:hypothetical protein